MKLPFECEVQAHLSDQVNAFTETDAAKKAQRVGEQVPGGAADTDGGRGLSAGPHGQRGREQRAKAPGQVP